MQSLYASKYSISVKGRPASISTERGKFVANADNIMSVDWSRYIPLSGNSTMNTAVPTISQLHQTKTTDIVGATNIERNRDSTCPGVFGTNLP